jgi:hypothetical protein
MPQETNLNVSPYFDDYSPENNYYKVLFKPGYPVQSRELTTLQSILQNQIEKLGQAFFKDGAKVIPGHFGYNTSYFAIQLNNSYLGIPIDAYISQLVGLKITGRTSGVTAVVDNYLFSSQSDRGTPTLYLNYIASSSQNNSSQTFLDGEELFTDTAISSGLLGSETIQAGQTFAITLANNAASTGSAFSISEGIYFIRGQFIPVQNETLILDQYTNTPNYRVGLFISEEIVNSDLDETLNDNSRGFNNYAAPGADRLRIAVSLFKKNIDDFNDANFIELVTINDGALKTKSTGDVNDVIDNEIAKRTWNQSGDYYISPFLISAKESLNDLVGNQGIFREGQLTYNGDIPSDNLAVYHVSPGKAVIRGYEVEMLNGTFLDFPKTRTTKTLENQAIIYNTGATFKLNRANGAPTIGIGNTYILSLRDSRVGEDKNSSPGREIGVARVYDYRLESGSYDTNNSNINQWNISLYDIQTISEIQLNEPITLSTPTFIRGNSSGATAFLKDPVTVGTSLTIYQKSGDFILNESFTFDGVVDNRVAIAVTSYGISDVKSVYGIVGSAKTFTADIIQAENLSIGIATISAYDTTTGLSTVFSPNELFPGRTLRPGNLVKYTDTSLENQVFAKIVSVGTTSIQISGIATVSGITTSKLPESTLQVTDFKILTTRMESSSDNTLYTRLPKEHISSLNLDNTTLSIRKTYTVNISGNKLSSPIDSEDNETFLPFDEERYFLVRSNGSYESLSSDQFEFTNNLSTLQIYNLGSNDTGATLVATLEKSRVKPKIKIKNRVNSIIVDKSTIPLSGIGSTTLNDGLAFGNYPYGTRVQDREICLNTGDIINVLGVYESRDSSSDPSAPTAILTTISGPSSKTSDLIIGERFVGQTSGSVALVAERLNDTQISFIYLNDIGFKEGETVIFEESDVQSLIGVLNSPSAKISNNFKYKNGQNGSYYGYGSVVRNTNSAAPSKKIKVYFSNGFYNPSDVGDITTIESYSAYDYGREIPLVNFTRNSDIIDIRPKVSDYNVQENTRSPLEFYGRVFSQSGNSAANILASDEFIRTDYSFYLGRIDRIFLTRDGVFQVKYGIPSEKPEKPVSVDNAIEIATATIPPYLYNVRDVIFNFYDYKRYQMKDIRALETRITNLEYYTTLSLLEAETANLFIADADGLNKFKSGFFVDNFSSINTQDTSIGIKNSVDFKFKELRPSHYTSSVDLQSYPSSNPGEDLRFKSPTGINVRRTEDIITLDYGEVEWLKQPFATRTENVVPFVLSFWQGTVELTPSSDTWIDTTRLEAKVIQAQGNYAETLANASRDFGVDPQTGFAPTVWNAWETIWTGQEIVEGTRERTIVTGGRWRGVSSLGLVPLTETQTTTVVREQLRETIDTGIDVRTGSQVSVVEQFDQTSVGDRVVSRDLLAFMRSRNITFVGKKLKPLTKVYAFFDGVDVTRFCVPKLLEISMISGTFQVGETVIADSRITGLGENSESSNPKIIFRVAKTNHREGLYTNPSVTYPFNPYTNESLPDRYSTTSTILNIDLFSLADQPQGDFYGWAETGMILKGETSGAQATITDVRLISDIAANLQGSFFIPDSNVVGFPRFESGNKVFTLINNESNDKNLASTFAEEAFSSQGTLETVQENIISVRNARVETLETSQQRDVTRTTGTVVTSSETLSSSSRSVVVGYYDPLAETFFVDDESGIFLTRCDVYFRAKDDSDIPVSMQIRTVELGSPTQKILPFSEVTLDPANVNTSFDGSVPTSFVFNSPIYLEGRKEYAVVLLSNSSKYTAYISRVGENDLITQEFISSQPYLGSLFKSQNAAIWEPSQWEDLKFTMYRADFLDSGTLEFYNPTLSEGNGQVAKLLPDSIELKSRKIRVGLGSTLQDSGLVLGNTIIQANNNATGNYVGSAGVAYTTLNIINPGIGYTPSPSDGGSYTFSGIALTTVTGNGSNATANITISGGVAIAATIVNGGNGYQIGDVVGVTSIGNSPAGRNIRFSIVSLASTNQIILDNVQGDFSVGVGGTLSYVNSSGSTVLLNASSGGNVSINAIDVEQTGLSIKVNHRNHGMYFSDNYVTISKVSSDIVPTKLVSAYGSDSTGPLIVESISNFSTFENVGISTTNPGYVLVGDEVIAYTSVSGNQIGGIIVRGVGGNIKNYPVGTPVYKYELGGVSLRRINKTHLLSSDESTINFDSYQIDLDTSVDGVDRSSTLSLPSLYFNENKSSGGPNIRASQNIPYEIITPMLQNLTVRGTSLNAQIRTVSGRSLDGNEFPFLDKGFESVSLNQSNYLDSTRLLCSSINEQQKLSLIANNKSFNMRVLLGTTDSRISPVIDLQRSNIILTSNRIDNPISNYATDPRSNTLLEDPTACQYVSKENRLANPASSIQVLLDAHINSYSDIRAFYAIDNEENFTPIFTPFPGWDNLDIRGEVIDASLNSGRPDAFAPETQSLGFSPYELEYKEYKFSINNLPNFRTYRIKIVMTGTNQAYPPRFRNLRVIALA